MRDEKWGDKKASRVCGTILKSVTYNWYTEKR